MTAILHFRISFAGMIVDSTSKGLGMLWWLESAVDETPDKFLLWSEAGDAQLMAWSTTAAKAAGKIIISQICAVAKTFHYVVC